MQTQDDQSWIEGLSQTEGEQCLSTLQSLAGQLGTAMNAIVQAKLPTLHDSIHLQQVNCGRLAELRHRSEERAAKFLTDNPIDADLALEINAATQSVLALSGQYSALLKHSGDTLQLLIGLYRSYTGFALSTAESQTGHPSWSCEV